MKKQILIILSTHRQVTTNQLDIDGLLASAFSNGQIPDNVGNILQLLLIDKYIQANFYDHKIISASITTAGESYLENLINAEKQAI